MKNSIKLFAGAALISVSAFATADQLSYVGLYNSNAVTGKITYTDGSGTHTTVNCYVDVLKFKLNGTTNINSLCGDLADILNGNSHSYTPSTIGSGSTGLDLAGRIVANNLTGVEAAMDPLQAAGLQLAVWYSVYNQPSAGFDFSNHPSGSHSFGNAGGTFGIDFTNYNATQQQSVVNYANTFYSNSNGGNAQYYGWQGGAGGQSQITTQAAPEPMSLAFIAIGAISMLARRKK